MAVWDRTLRNVENHLRVLATLGCVTFSGCGPRGVITHTSDPPEAPKAEFRIAKCQALTHTGIAATDARYYLVNGRRSYGFLVLDAEAKGQEIENYYKDDQGHHFVVIFRRRAWKYSFPDEVGADGQLEYFERPSYTTAVNGVMTVEGKPVETCELTWSEPTGQSAPSTERSVAAERVEVAPPQACVPGSTQACVGSAGCRGGQHCLSDGSGFAPCDCGSAAGESSEANSADEESSDTSNQEAL